MTAQSTYEALFIIILRPTTLFINACINNLLIYFVTRPRFAFSLFHRRLFALFSSLSAKKIVRTYVWKQLVSIKPTVNSFQMNICFYRQQSSETIRSSSDRITPNLSNTSPCEHAQTNNIGVN